ncbi:unnamed protein product [Phaedon cochleariae]|uniref:Double jelly roll-like domain-containing protein n=1 Tax=Phaedon cochleariae TaxID=80249 RepID=A0A9N9SKA2_PHACE|nr:unnamed protein product [Phaedon cochleariae]
MLREFPPQLGHQPPVVNDEANNEPIVISDDKPDNEPIVISDDEQEMEVDDEPIEMSDDEQEMEANEPVRINVDDLAPIRDGEVIFNYIPEGGIIYKACILRNKNGVKFVGDNKIICCMSSAKDMEQSFMNEISILEKTIEELQEDTEVKDKHMKKLKNDMDKFMEDALKSEEEMCELIAAQNQTIVEAETRMIELQKIIEQLQTKSTCTTSTQTTLLCKTTREISTQSVIDVKNTYIQTECNGDETGNFDILKNKPEFMTAVGSTQCNIPEPTVEESTKSIECVNGIETPTEVKIMENNKSGMKLQKKKKQHLKEKPSNFTGNTYSTDFSIDIIEPDSIRPSTHDCGTSAQWRTSSDPASPQRQMMTKVAFPHRKMLIYGDEYATDFPRVVERANTALPGSPQTQNIAKITIESINLKVPHLTPNDDIKLQLLTRIKADESMMIPFRRWELHELPALTQGSTIEIWSVKTCSALDSPRYVIVFFQTKKADNLHEDVTLFDNANIKSIRLALNSDYYPQERMLLDFSRDQYADAHFNYTEFNKSYHNCQEKRSLVNFAEFKSRPMFVIDCSRRHLGLKSSTVDIKVFLIFNMMSNTAHAHNVEVTAGAFWKALPSTLAYEATLPLIYETNWPEVGYPNGDSHEGQRIDCTLHVIDDQDE